MNSLSVANIILQASDNMNSLSLTFIFISNESSYWALLYYLLLLRPVEDSSLVINMTRECTRMNVRRTTDKLGPNIKETSNSGPNSLWISSHIFSYSQEDDSVQHVNVLTSPLYLSY